MKRVVALCLLAGLVTAACSKSEKESEAEGEGSQAPCAAASAAVATPPALPAGFPTPTDVTYTATEVAGPSTIVEGYWNGGLEDAFEGYKDAFEQAGYDVTGDEKEEDDAEVNFSGGSSTGQVKLVSSCEGRTSVRITIRPA
jgi:hypothetical protein